MKKILKLRNSIIAILCFTIICMAIGFSFLTIKLENIEKNKPHFNVIFKKIIEQTAVKGGSIAPECKNSITNSSKEVNMKCSLNAPHDDLSYIIIIKNTGNIDASILSLKENIAYLNNTTSTITNSPIKITHTDVTDKVLKPNEELSLKVYIKYSNEFEIKDSQKFDYSLCLIAASPEN